MANCVQLSGVSPVEDLLISVAFVLDLNVVLLEDINEFTRGCGIGSIKRFEFGT